MVSSLQIAEGVEVAWVQSDGDGDPILCVLCTEVSVEPFQKAAIYAQAALDLPSLKAEEIERNDNPHLDHVPQLEESLDYLGSKGGQWSTMCCLTRVLRGPSEGLRVVGVGSNVKKRERASNLALALAARPLPGGGDGELEMLRSHLGPHPHHLRSHVIENDGVDERASGSDMAQELPGPPPFTGVFLPPEDGGRPARMCGRCKAATCGMALETK